VLERLEDRNRRRPLHAGFGLYQGYRALEPARNLFVRQFNVHAYGDPTGVARRALEKRDAEFGFAALEALVRNWVLSRQLNGTAAVPLGPNDALVYFWADKQTPPQEVRDAYARGYFSFLRWRPGAEAAAEKDADFALIKAALPEMFTVDRVADWTDKLYPPFRAQEIPVPAAIANDATVRGAFTGTAWTERVLPLASTVDLIAAEFDKELVPTFRRQYLERYFREWLQFVLRPNEPPSESGAAAALLGDKSPYIAIVDTTAKAAAVDVDERERPAWAKTVMRLSAEHGAYVAQLQPMANQLRSGESDPAGAVDETKQIYNRRAVVATDGAEAPAQDPFGRAEQWVVKTVAVETAADADDAQVRTRLLTLLRAPVYVAFGEYVYTAARELDRHWRRRVSGAFGSVSSPADLQALYGPQGIIWDFYRTYLEPYFDRDASFAPKVRYTKPLPIDPSLLPYLRNAEGMGKRLFSGGGGGLKQFPVMVQSVPSSDAGGVRVTRTVLSVFCGQGEAWRLEHRQFRASKQLVWTPETCNRTELAVYVGTPGETGLGDERPLEPLVFDGPMGFVNFLRAGRASGRRYSWTFPGAVSAQFDIEVSRDIFALSGGGAPPSKIVR
jgi:hypothetical protein